MNRLHYQGFLSFGIFSFKCFLSLACFIASFVLILTISSSFDVLPRVTLSPSMLMSSPWHCLAVFMALLFPDFRVTDPWKRCGWAFKDGEGFGRIIHGGF